VLRIDGHGYSPAVIDKIVSAGGDCKSFRHAAAQLKKLAELPISQTHVSNLTHEIGRELIAARDAQAERNRYRQLPPPIDQPPIELACVEIDGGRLLTRSPEQSRGVHDKQWKEPKVAVLWRMTSKTHQVDPHPNLPRCFQDEDKVEKLVREVHGGRTKSAEETEHGITLEEITGSNEAVSNEAGSNEAGSNEAGSNEAGSNEAGSNEAGSNEAVSNEAGSNEAGSNEAGSNEAGSNEAGPPPNANRWQPKRVFRTCVATMRDVYGFGPLVAAEARKRGFYQAQRKAFLGDGQEANWTVHRLHFPDFTPVVDFMHVVCRVYAAARAMTGAKDLRKRYLQDAAACWQGRVAELIETYKSWLREHPLPELPLKEIPDADPRKIVYETLTYFENNRDRMNYPAYRCQGMPVTSSLIESLIKEMNWRVKGSDKYWNRPEETPTSRRTSRPVGGRSQPLPEASAESILQVRAALLCDDQRLAKFVASRSGCPYVRRRSTNSPLSANYAV
jgi:hypothetical protein